MPRFRRDSPFIRLRAMIQFGSRSEAGARVISGCWGGTGGRIKEQAAQRFKASAYSRVSEGG